MYVLALLLKQLPVFIKGGWSVSVRAPRMVVRQERASLMRTNHVNLNSFDRYSFIDLLRSLLLPGPIKFYMNCVFCLDTVSGREWRVY